MRFRDAWEGWWTHQMRTFALQKKFACCPEPWVLLEASLVVRRKPLYYTVNLVIPATIITLVAVIGFFTPATTNNERRDKLSLGIDSLLAMSFLMMMIGEKMPVTSEYVPLFGNFFRFSSNIFEQTNKRILMDNCLLHAKILFVITSWWYTWSRDEF